MAARARLLDAMREQFTKGTPAAERRLLRGASEVHRIVGAIEGDPSNDGVQRLEHAFRALERAGDEARATGVADTRVTEIIEVARTACVSLLFEVIVPLVDAVELKREDFRAQTTRDYR